ncbi:MAG: hypothetical protein ACTSXT_16425 [Candidatus Helarchaeota archaeon]
MTKLEIKTELLKIGDEFQYFLDNYPIKKYVLNSIRDENMQEYYQILKQLRKKGVIFSNIHKKNKPIIVAPENIEKYINTYNFEVSEADLNIFDNRNRKIILNILYQYQRKYLLDKGYKISKNTYYEGNYNFIKNIHKPKSDILLKLYEYIRLYYGFTFLYKIYGDKIYVHIKPRSIINLEIDIYEMLSLLSKKEIIEYFNKINLPYGRSGKILFFTDFTSDNYIESEPFFGTSLIEYYKENYEIVLNHKDAPVLYCHLNVRKPFRFYSSECAIPSLNFTNLSMLDVEFESDINSFMKKRSSTRKNVIELAKENMHTFAFNHNFKFEELVSAVGDNDPINADKIRNLSSITPFKVFARPSVNFRDQDGEIVEINEFSGLTASPGDLLTDSTLQPFKVPKEISVLSLLPAEYYEAGVTLLERIKEGYRRYPAFNTLFNCEIKNEIKMIRDYNSYTDEINKINPTKYDCTIFIAPRKLSDNRETVNLYTRLEKESLNRRVPAQFITDNPRNNPNYDSSLESKAKDPEVLFGISINILGKIGGTILKPAPRVVSNFISDSVILSYNITRVYQNVDYGSSKNPYTLAKTSIPYVAPTLTFSERGTEIRHQLLHQIPEETSFFKSDQAQTLIDSISENHSNVIIHKDGPFFPSELKDLENISTDKKIIPISIITNSVPRLFSNLAEISFTAPHGTVFELSNQDYLVASSLFTSRRVPEKFGWPNPLHVRFYSKDITEKVRIKLLYQIWVMTRLYLNSKIPTRRPLSVHYANKISEFLTKNGRADLPFLNKFMNYRNRHDLIPRLFL